MHGIRLGGARKKKLGTQTRGEDGEENSETGEARTQTQGAPFDEGGAENRRAQETCSDETAEGEARCQTGDEEARDQSGAKISREAGSTGQEQARNSHHGGRRGHT